MKGNEKIDKKKVAKNAIIGAVGAPMMSTGITAAFEKMDGNSIRKSIKDTAKELKNNKVARYSMLGGSLASATALGAHSALSQRKKQKEKTASDIVNDNFEKMAGIGKKLSMAQSLAGAGVGALLGGTIGYGMGKEHSYLEKMKPIDRYKNDKKNGFNKFINEDGPWAHKYDMPHIIQRMAPMSDKVGDLGRYPVDSNSMSNWAKNNKVSLNDMKMTDYINLTDEIGVNQWLGEGNDKELEKLDRDTLRRKALKLIGEGDIEPFSVSNNIEKKAFFTEALAAGALSGAGAYGVRRGINKVQEVFGPKTRKAKREFKDFNKNEANTPQFQAYNDSYEFKKKMLNELLASNPDITYGEAVKKIDNGFLDALNKSLKKENKMNKTAFDIANDNFEKMAANKYTKYLESSGNEFERRRRERKLGIKPGTSKEQIRKKVFNKDLGVPKLQNRLNKYKFGPGAEVRRRAKINDKIESLEGKNKDRLSKINNLKARRSELHANVDKINEMVDKNKSLAKNIGDMQNDLVNSYKKARNATIKKKLPLVVGATALATAGTGYGVYKGIKAKGNKANNKTAFDIVNNSFEKIALTLIDY